MKGRAHSLLKGLDSPREVNQSAGLALVSYQVIGSASLSGQTKVAGNSFVEQSRVCIRWSLPRAFKQEFPAPFPVLR